MLPGRLVKKAKATGPPPPTVAEITVSVTPTDLRNRLTYLLPVRVINLILDSQYEIPGRPQEYRPLFALARDGLGSWVYSLQEVTEIVGVYDNLRGIHTATGAETDPVKYLYSQEAPLNYAAEDDDQTYATFKDHIESLVLARKLKEVNQTLLPDDTVFEAPTLAEVRQEEILRTALINRKKIPVKDLKCRKCRVEEVNREEHYTRSGDEPAVEHFKCGRCGYTWRD